MSGCLSTPSLPGKWLLSALFLSSIQLSLPQPPGAKLFSWHPKVSEPVPVDREKVLGQRLERSGVGGPLQPLKASQLPHICGPADSWVYVNMRAHTHTHTLLSLEEWQGEVTETEIECKTESERHTSDRERERSRKREMET